MDFYDILNYTSHGPDQSASEISISTGLGRSPEGLNYKGGNPGLIAFLVWPEVLSALQLHPESAMWSTFTSKRPPYIIL